MSTINTNGIDTGYPRAGENNSTQGFRTNFASIKNSIDTAAAEITDLQNKSVLKSALNGAVINNDLNGTLISNALVRSFKATTYNLGNALVGTVLIDVSKGDVQMGAIAGNVNLQFTGWTANSQNNVELQLAVANANAVVSFPAAISSNNCYGVTTLESYANVANVATVTIPYGVCQLDYRLSSTDCGNTITIEPFNRPRRSTEIRQRTPAPTGFPGDVAGTVAVDANYVYICTGTYDSTTVSKVVSNTTATTNEVKFTTDTSSLVANAPIIFSGNVYGGIAANTVYYIKTIVGANNAVTISDSRVAGAAGAAVVLSTANGNTFDATSYNGSSIWKKTALATW